MRISSFAMSALLCMASSAGFASSVISSYTAGADSTPNANYYGEQFAITTPGSYDDITFNFFSLTGSSVAAGTGYLFSTPYTGPESGLSTATTGLLGTGTASAGVYTFGSGVTLDGGDTYYFYEDSLFGPNAIAGGFTAPTGTDALYSAGSADSFASLGDGSSWDYSVSGTPVAATVTPEPSSIALLGTGLLGVAGVLKRRLA